MSGRTPGGLGAGIARRRAALASLALAFAGCGDGPPHDLLLVTVDTLRADRLGCYGGPPESGEAICGLADEGTRFAWAFAAASATVPSIASLLTAQYPAFHGVSQGVDLYLADAAVTVTEMLRDAGYTTGAVVSNPMLDSGRNLGQGFETYDDLDDQGKREARATTDAALAWLQSRAQSPWFLWVHYQDPHGPYSPPGAPRVRDDPKDKRLRVAPNDYMPQSIPRYQALPGIFTPGAYEQLYLAEIAHVDAQIARLVAGCDALGRRRPAILLTADHGEAFGEDGFYFMHGQTLGLEQIRVPLLWRPPRPHSATVVEDPVSLVDVAPSLLQLAGIEMPESFQGRVLPLDGYARPEPDPERALFAEQSRRVAVVVGRLFYERERQLRQPGQRPRYAIPDRAAALQGDGLLPEYVRVSEDVDSRRLEPALRRYLDSTVQPVEAPSESDLPDEMRERLRALGYTD